jgi:hypothetical protein
VAAISRLGTAGSNNTSEAQTLLLPVVAAQRDCDGCLLHEYLFNIDFIEQIVLKGYFNEK